MFFVGDILKPPSAPIRTSIACGKPAGFRDPGWTSEPPISLARFALCAGQRDAGGGGVGEGFLMGLYHNYLTVILLNLNKL